MHRNIAFVVGALVALSQITNAATVFKIDLQMAGSPSDQEAQAGWSVWDVDKVTTNNAIVSTVAGVGITINSNGGGYVTARGGGLGTGENRGGDITGTSWDDVVEDFAVARGGDGTAALTLTNLNSSLTYTLTVHHNESYDLNSNPGFSGGTQTPSITTGTLVGVADAGLITWNTAGAHTDGDFDQSVISFMPDPGGNASILLTSSSNFVLFNGIELDAVPEPSSAALLGLGGLALVMRRRR